MASEKKYAIRIAAQSRFLPEQSNPDQGVFAFAYTMTITWKGSRFHGVLYGMAL